MIGCMDIYSSILGILRISASLISFLFKYSFCSKYSPVYQMSPLLESTLFNNNRICGQMTTAGNMVPFSEPPYLSELPSPYYTTGRLQFQRSCRHFMRTHLHSHALEWERAGTVPDHGFRTFCQHNMLLPNMPAPLPVSWLKRLGIDEIMGVKVEDWDYIYTGIYADVVCFFNMING